MMTKREVVHAVLAGKKPPYVPWSCGFTKEAREKLQAHYGAVDLEDALQNHLLKLGSDIGFFTELLNFRDLISEMVS
jgi:uroporphyrinogen decarboxylase